MKKAKGLFCKLYRVFLVTVFSSALLSGSAVSNAAEYVSQGDLGEKKVAVLAGEGLHDGETLFPIGYLVNRGALVTVIGVERGYVKAYNSDTWVRIEKSVDEVSASDFDAIVIPGGRSPAYLRGYDHIVSFTRDAALQGKVIAAICHGPQILITAGVLEGKSATCFPAVMEEIIEAGAKYEDVPMIRDGNVITSRVPDDLPAFVGAIEEALLSQ